MRAGSGRPCAGGRAVRGPEAAIYAGPMRTRSGEARVDGAGLVRAPAASSRSAPRSAGSPGCSARSSRAVALGSATVGVGAAYNLANNTPNMIYDLLLGGVLSATLVPVLVANRERGDDEGTDAVLTVATRVPGRDHGAGHPARPGIVHLYGAIAHAGPDPPRPSRSELATLLLRLFAPQVLFYGLTTLATALLNAHRRFAAAAFAPVVNNVMLIAVLLAGVAGHWATTPRRPSRVATARSSAARAWGPPPGSRPWPLVLWPAITRPGIPLRWRFDLRHPAVRQVARLSGWTLGYVVANQITLFVHHLAGLRHARRRRRVGLDLRLPVLPAALRRLHRVGDDRLHPGAGHAWPPSTTGTAFQDRFLFGLRLVMLVLLPATVMLRAAGPADRVGAAVLRALPRRRRPDRPPRRWPVWPGGSSGSRSTCTSCAASTPCATPGRRS